MNNLEVKSGVFVEFVHDLRAGVYFYGPYPDEGSAKNALHETSGLLKIANKSWDECNIIQADYVSHKGEIYPLIPATTAASETT